LNVSPGTLANMMIGAGDTDENGKITFNEIINEEGPEVFSDLIGHDFSKDDFAKLDTDGNNKLNKEEIRTALRKAFCPKPF